MYSASEYIGVLSNKHGRVSPIILFLFEDIVFQNDLGFLW